MPQLAAPLAPGHPLLAALDAGAPAIALGPLGAAWAPLDPAWDAWLAIPLRHAGRLAGCVLVTRPRAPFRLDPEVFELLRILAHEVASYLAEQRAARVLLETRELRAYGERFAFVAHDIKNVSSQLSLLLSNAETHLANPDFQRDMLLTVRASVRKIGALIRRLESPEQLPAQPPRSGAVEGPEPAHPERLDLLVVVEHLESLASRMRRLRGAAIVVDHNGCGGCVAMDSAVFDSVITHLLDNAIEASGVGQPVHLRLREEAGRAVVEIIDSGHGMQPEFVRDQLFRPFRTSKQRGSGIGAFQARALLRAASGDLLVESRPGMGTTMRLLLPLAPPQVVRLTA